jgi:hypothetical protein
MAGPGQPQAWANGMPGPLTGGGSRSQGAAYGPARRAAYGILWAVMTVIFLISAFIGLAGHSWLLGILAILVAGVSAYYDFQIWTYRARRLWGIRFL